jgi:hypothetical protein
MNPQTRKLLIQRLVPAIGVIGPDFERFAGLVLDHVLPTPLEHTGLNVLGYRPFASAHRGPILAESGGIAFGGQRAETDIRADMDVVSI